MTTLQTAGAAMDSADKLKELIARQAVEIERLIAAYNMGTESYRALEKERDAAQAEIERLQTAVKHLSGAAAGASPVQPSQAGEPDTSVLQVAQWPPVGDAQPAHARAIDTSLERVEKQAGDVQVPDYREIADCVLAGLEDRKGVLNLDVDADIEEEIRQEVADNIRMMLTAAPSTKEGQP